MMVYRRICKKPPLSILPTIGTLPMITRTEHYLQFLPLHDHIIWWHRLKDSTMILINCAYIERKSSSRMTSAIAFSFPHPFFFHIIQPYFVLHMYCNIASWNSFSFFLFFALPVLFSSTSFPYSIFFVLFFANLCCFIPKSNLVIPNSKLFFFPSTHYSLLSFSFYLFSSIYPKPMCVRATLPNIYTK